MKIDLKSIKKIITHDNCGDGLAAAIILRSTPGLEHVPIEFHQHNTAALDNLEPCCALFVDFTPPRARALEWAQQGAYVLDHHEHAKDIVALFGERGLFDNGRSGALLAYDEVYRSTCRDVKDDDGSEMLVLATLADIRDRWLTDSPDWDNAEAAHKALMAVHRSEWLKEGGTSLPDCSDQEYGAKLARSEVADAKDVVRQRTTWRIIDGLTVGFCAESGRLMISQIGEQGRELAGADLMVNVMLKRDGADVFKIVFSMRSGEAFDCGAFAKSQGGGGHAKAAGFTVELSEIQQGDPHGLFEHALRGYSGYDQ